MAKEPRTTPHDGTLSAQARRRADLAQALKANLLRRKSQARGRKAGEGGTTAPESQVPSAPAGRTGGDTPQD